MAIDKKQLQADFEAFTSESSLKELFELANNGNKHSFGNNLMKLYQAGILGLKDFANVTKGFKQWQKENVKVLKGSKAMYIFAPMTKKKENDNGEKYNAVVGFRLVAVFDVSQTDKFEAYKAERAEFEGRVYQDNFPLEVAEKLLAGQADLTYKKVTDVDGAKGFYRPKDKYIEYNNGYTAIHELSHHLFLDKEKSYAYNELLAEMGSLALCNRYGVKFSFEYSNIWNSRISEIEEKFDYKAFSKEYKRIESLVDKAIESAGIEVEKVA
jgi:antirestriction protein ArdC